MGGNLGDPQRAFREALAALATQAGLRLRARSGLYRTTPVGGPAQPDYLNACALFECDLAADQALARLHSIERQFGRTRSFVNHPRTLDLDLLLLGTAVHRSPRLIVPHPRMLERGFVMIPASDVAPLLRHPLAGVTLSTAAESLPSDGIERIGEPGDWS